MGRGSKVRVICKRGRKNPKLVQDGSQEFITVIEGVSANGVILPPLVINKGKAHYMGWHTYVSEMNQLILHTQQWDGLIMS